jgi:outer membrane protein assembly factor BamB
MSTAAVPQPSSRLWMPLLVLVGVPLAGAAVWYWPSDWDHGHRTISVQFLALLSVLLLGFWLLFLSRWPRWVRLTPVALLIAGVAVLAATLRDVHFTGDMLPVFTFRWEPTADELLERDRERQAAEPKPLATAEPTVALVTRRNPFPTFFGHRGGGEVLGVKLHSDWRSDPPREVWRQRSGGGYSGFVVADGRAVTIEQRREEEVVVAYDVDTGRELWRHHDSAHFKETQGGDGPRATPSIVGFGGSPQEPKDFKVFALGATGHLVCLDLQNGEQVWSADVLKGNANLRWGMSGSPLALSNGTIVVTPGAQTEGAKGRGVIAYDMRTGTEVWASGTHRGAYSSPALGHQGQLLVFDGEGLTGYQGADGKELWHYPWVPMPPQGINASQPLRLDNDRIFISSGYDTGSAMLRVKETGGKWEVETLWQNTAMRCKFTSPVYRNGYLYGLDEGILTCLDARDGKRLWKGGRYGHGQLLLVDKHLLILSERGDLVLVEATPEAHRERGKLHVLDGDKTWNPPALGGNYAFVRNHEWMACYELPAAEVFRPVTSIPLD